MPEALVGESPMYGPTPRSEKPQPQTWDEAQYPAPMYEDAVAAPPDTIDAADDAAPAAPIYQPATGWSLYWDSECVTAAPLTLSTHALEPEIAVVLILVPDDLDVVLSALLELRADQYRALGQQPPMPAEWSAWLGIGVRGYPAETPPPRFDPSEFEDGDFPGENATYVDVDEYSIHWADDLWAPVLTLTSSNDVNPVVACEVILDSVTLQTLLYGLLELRYAQCAVTAQPVTVPEEWKVALGLDIPTAVAAPPSPADAGARVAAEKRKGRFFTPWGLERAMRSRTGRDTWLLRAAVSVLIGALIFVLLQRMFF